MTKILVIIILLISGCVEPDSQPETKINKQVKELWVSRDILRIETKEAICYLHIPSYRSGSGISCMLKQKENNDEIL